MSWTARILLFVATLAAVVALVWMAFLPAIVEHELRVLTGFEFRVEVLSANPVSGRVVVRGMKALNPAGYPSPDFVELRQLSGDVGVFSWLFRGKIVVDDLDLEVAKIVLIREHDGRTNAGDFMAAFRGRPPGGLAPLPVVRPRSFLIHKLHLRLDRLEVQDYSGSKLDSRGYDLGIDQTFIDVTSTGQLLVPSVVNRLHDFGLHHDIARLLPGEFGQALAGAVGLGASMGSRLKDLSLKTGDALKGALDKLEQKPKP
jgi:hypothetical protein